MVIHQIISLLETRTLPSVFTLGKGKKTLGKGFTECGTRQSLHGKIRLGKETLPSAFFRDARQNINIFCRVLTAALGKIFSAVTPLTVSLPSATKKPLGKVFFLNFS